MEEYIISTNELIDRIDSLKKEIEFYKSKQNPNYDDLDFIRIYEVQIRNIKRELIQREKDNATTN